MIDVEALQRENAELRVQVTTLIQEVAKLNERLAELLAIAQRKKRKTMSPGEKKPEAPPVVTASSSRTSSSKISRPRSRSSNIVHLRVSNRRQAPSDELLQVF